MSEWHKASYSQGDINCVEVQENSEGARVRDTQNRELGHLEFGSDQWVGLMATLSR